MSETLLREIIQRLAAIEAILRDQAADVARCGHGATGLCMSCVIQNDLMRPQAPRR